MRQHRAAGCDPTCSDAARRAGELDDLLPSHDIHEPTLLERVYVLLDRKACQVKIGWTRQPIRMRLHQIEAKSGRSLELVGTMVGGRNLETALHGRFNAYRCEKLECSAVRFSSN